ncbi:MAG: nitroreductase family protein [Clostridia bacterium]|nr:nitroreductase family protein [Clostridia bacterium]
MNGMECIFSRRSIRSYTGEMPSGAELDQILRAVYAAPVGMGRYDSLHVTVVKNPDYLARLEAAAGAQLGKENYHPLYGAPVLLIFSSVFPGIPTDNSSYSNCAILSQNAALAAVSLGLGACHIWGAIRALNKEPQLLSELNLPEGFVPCCALALGRTQERYEERTVADNRMMTRTME